MANLAMISDARGPEAVSLIYGVASAVEGDYLTVEARGLVGDARAEALVRMFQTPDRNLRHYGGVAVGYILEDALASGQYDVLLTDTSWAETVALAQKYPKLPVVRLVTSRNVVTDGGDLLEGLNVREVVVDPGVPERPGSLRARPLVPQYVPPPMVLDLTEPENQCWTTVLGALIDNRPLPPSLPASYSIVWGAQRAALLSDARVANRLVSTGPAQSVRRTVAQAPLDEAVWPRLQAVLHRL